MVITPKQGWKQDPNNAGGVIRDLPESGLPIAPQTTLEQDMLKASQQGKAGFDMLGNRVGGQTPAKEPTIISSSTITDKVIPELQKKATAYSQKGTYVGQDGATRFSDGSAVPAPVTAEYDPTTKMWKDGAGTYVGAPQLVNNEDEDPAVGQINELLAGLKMSLDSSTFSQINAVHQQFDMLRQQQQEANARADKARTTLNIKSGASRYAPLDAAGTALAQTTYGLRQIQKLDADENSAIAQVRAAQQSGNFELMSKAMTIVESTRKAKQEAAQKVADQLSKANEKMMEARAKASRDEAITDLVGQGITDPAKILSALNENGTSEGSFTLDEIKKALSNLQTTKEEKDAYKFANDDVGKLLGAGLSMPVVQAVQDYYNGKADASVLEGLTTAQKAAIQTALVGKVPTVKSETAGEDAFKFTTSQKSQLLSGNFTTADINNMQTDLAAHGIDSVVQGLPEAQQSLVKRVLANSDTVANVGSGIKLTRASVSKLFGIPDDDKGQDIFGGSSNKQKLDEIADFIGRYREVGYEDDQILKILQESQKE